MVKQIIMEKTDVPRMLLSERGKAVSAVSNTLSNVPNKVRRMVLE